MLTGLRPTLDRRRPIPIIHRRRGRLEAVFIRGLRLGRQSPPRLLLLLLLRWLLLLLRRLLGIVPLRGHRRRVAGIGGLGSAAWHGGFGRWKGLVAVAVGWAWLRLGMGFGGDGERRGDVAVGGGVAAAWVLLLEREG